MRFVWNSFGGRFSDNPRALWQAVSAAAGTSHLWLVDPAYQHQFPDDVAAVEVDTPAAVRALESADVVVANTHIEAEWIKPASTMYLQTWHGTPLKRIHRDVLWAPPGRLDQLDRDVAQWDLLLSPNAVSTPRLRRAFRYEGEVLESGYPRNDLLSGPRAAEVRARTRAELGLDANATVVLYAPTWRDDEVLGGTANVELPDLVHAVPGLGTTTDLLVRAHNLVGTRARVKAADGVHDVSDYADVADLYCAADVLVTDYSSTMFDFTITGRPVIHLAYDLRRFRDSIRGFYTDLEATAAGPIVETAEELSTWLADLSWAHESPWAERYDRFRRTYTAWEDGRATERVVSRLGLGAGSSPV